MWDYEKSFVEIEGEINNILTVSPPVDCKKLFIIRGVSGSGKSTLAKKILLEYGGSTFAEADKFMVDENGNYFFDPKRLTFAHESCSKVVEQAMIEEQNVVVVSNTSIQYWEMYKYVQYAQQYGYDIDIRETDTEWRYDPDVLYQKNHHSVPLASIKTQLENFKKYPTLPIEQMVPKILATGGCRPTLYRPGINFQPFQKLVYYGVRSTDISPWIESLKNYLGKEKFDLYNRYRWERDGGPIDDGTEMYHLTLTAFSPKGDVEPKSEEYILSLKKILEESPPEYLGIGTVQSDDSESYYLIVKWDEVTKLRETLNLKPLTLHITLGFKIKDIHNIPKTPDTKLPLEPYIPT
jgi:gluconate kinase